MLRKPKRTLQNAVSSPRVSCTVILLFQSGLDPEALIGAISMLTVGYSPLVSVCYRGPQDEQDEDDDANDES